MNTPNELVRALERTNARLRNALSALVDEASVTYEADVRYVSTTSYRVALDLLASLGHVRPHARTCLVCTRWARYRGVWGEWYCRAHWVAAGMHDPAQGFESPTCPM